MINNNNNDKNNNNKKKQKERFLKGLKEAIKHFLKKKKIINILMNDVKIFPKRTKTKNNNKVTNNIKIFLKMKRKAS